jgi:hypothetical protein
LYERQTIPKYRFCVLNRVETNDLFVDIVPDLQTQKVGEYLMFKISEDDTVVNGLWIFGDDNLEKLLQNLQDCVGEVQPVEETESPKQLTPLTQSVTFNEIWESLENMASHPLPLLAETEFLARFHILVQVLIVNRIPSLPEQCTKDIPVIDNKHRQRVVRFYG